jgi:beta-phosphoglucomutase-like phosphatase (HAD superfamily)
VPAIPAGIDAVIFDFDGTLADTTPRHEQALRAALQPHGLGLDHDWYRRHAGLSIHDLLAALPGGRPLPHDEIIRQSRAYLLATVHSITPIACAVSLLSAARGAGLPCAVASGASRLLIHPGIDALGLRHAFAAVVVREDVTHGKPAPDLYLAAARRLGVPPDRCLAVDDAREGVASAQAAGMHVITIADGHLVPADDGPQGAAHFASPAGTPVPHRTPHGGAAGQAPALKTTAAPHHASPDTAPPRSEDSAT